MTNWQTKKLGDIATIKRGGSPRPIQDYIVSNDQDGYSWLKIGDVPVGSRYIYKTGAKIKPEGLKKTTLVRKGEFILSNSMSFGRPYIMMTDACIHDGWLALQDIDNGIDKNFLYYLLTSDQMQNKLKNYSAGSGVLNLKKETVQEIDFKSPEKSEQERIVGVLEVWDEYIEKLEQKIALKEQLKKGLMQQLLTGKQRLPGFSGEWQSTQVGKIAEVNPSSDELPEKFLYIDLEVVVTGKLVRKPLLISRQHAPSRAQRLLKRGDVLFQTVRPYQKNNYFFDLDGSNYVASTGYAQLRAKGSSRFLYHFLQNDQFVKAALKMCTGSNYPAITSGDLSKIRISYPNPEEQHAIESILSTLDAEIDFLITKAGKVKLQKKYLLKNLITGKIRTPETLTPKGVSS